MAAAFATQTSPAIRGLAEKGKGPNQDILMDKTAVIPSATHEVPVEVKQLNETTLPSPPTAWWLRLTYGASPGEEDSQLGTWAEPSEDFHLLKKKQSNSGVASVSQWGLHGPCIMGTRCMTTWVRSSHVQDVTFGSCFSLSIQRAKPEGGETVLAGPALRHVCYALA